MRANAIEMMEAIVLAAAAADADVFEVFDTWNSCSLTCAIETLYTAETAAAAEVDVAVAEVFDHGRNLCFLTAPNMKLT